MKELTLQTQHSTHLDVEHSIKRGKQGLQSPVSLNYKIQEMMAEKMRDQMKRHQSSSIPIDTGHDTQVSKDQSIELLDSHQSVNIKLQNLVLLLLAIIVNPPQ